MQSSRIGTSEVYFVYELESTILDYFCIPHLTCTVCWNCFWLVNEAFENIITNILIIIHKVRLLIVQSNTEQPYFILYCVDLISTFAYLSQLHGFHCFILNLIEPILMEANTSSCYLSKIKPFKKSHKIFHPSKNFLPDMVTFLSRNNSFVMPWTYFDCGFLFNRLLQPPRCIRHC